jgi:hypothetical protein
MPSSEYYRREAQRGRDLAMNSLDLQAARRWRAIAADYDKLAEAFDACPPRDNT